MLDDWMKRAVRMIGRAAKGDARQPFLAGRPAQGIDEARFADAWLAADEYDPTVPLFLGLLPGAAQQPDLLVAADQREIARRRVELDILCFAQSGDAPDLLRLADT